MDDRGRRPAAHRDAAGEARRGRRAVQRLPALGQPACGRAEVRDACLPGRSRPRTCCCSPARTAARCYASSPARSPAPTASCIEGPGSTHTPITLVHASVSHRARSCRCRGRPTTTRSPTSTAGSGTVGTQGDRPVHAGRARGVRCRRSHHPRRRRPRRTAARRRWRSSCSAGEPIGEPIAAVRTVRHEHPRRSCSRRSTITSTAGSVSSRRTRSCRTSTAATGRPRGNREGWGQPGGLGAAGKARELPGRGAGPGWRSSTAAGRRG